MNAVSFAGLLKEWCIGFAYDFTKKPEDASAGQSIVDSASRVFLCRVFVWAYALF